MADEILEGDGAVADGNPEDAQLLQLCSLWQTFAPSHALTAEDKAQLFRYLVRFDLASVQLALADAVDFYLYAKKESVEVTLQKVGGILYNRRLEQGDPELALFRRVYYIVRRRLNPTPVDAVYEEPGDTECDEAMELLELAHRRGVPLKDLEIAARSARTMEQFNNAVIEHVRLAADKRSRPDITMQVNVSLPSNGELPPDA